MANLKFTQNQTFTSRGATYAVIVEHKLTVEEHGIITLRSTFLNPDKQKIFDPPQVEAYTEIDFRGEKPLIKHYTYKSSEKNADDRFRHKIGANGKDELTVRNAETRKVLGNVNEGYAPVKYIDPVILAILLEPFALISYTNQTQDPDHIDPAIIAMAKKIDDYRLNKVDKQGFSVIKKPIVELMQNYLTCLTVLPAQARIGGAAAAPPGGAASVA